jgi:hypothetical protein
VSRSSQRRSTPEQVAPHYVWRIKVDVRNRTELCLIAAAVLFGVIMGFAGLIPA